MELFAIYFLLVLEHKTVSQGIVSSPEKSFCVVDFQ